jgi:hypothetical protein
MHSGFSHALGLSSCSLGVEVNVLQTPNRAMRLMPFLQLGHLRGRGSRAVLTLNPSSAIGQHAAVQFHPKPI